MTPCRFSRDDSHKLLLTCYVITVAANDLVQPFHDRMPVKEAGPLVNSPKNDGPECIEAA